MLNRTPLWLQAFVRNQSTTPAPGQGYRRLAIITLDQLSQLLAGMELGKEDQGSYLDRLEEILSQDIQEPDKRNLLQDLCQDYCSELLAKHRGEKEPELLPSYRSRKWSTAT